MYTELRVANYSGKIKDLTSYYPFDDFIPVTVGRTDVEKLGMIFTENDERYVIMISKSFAKDCGFNTRISVAGPRKERVNELIEEFQKKVGIKAKPPSKYLREEVKFLDKQFRAVKIGSIEDLYANCLVCDACQRYYILKYIPKDPLNRGLLEDADRVFLNEERVSLYSILPRVKTIVSEKLDIPEREFTKKDLCESLEKLSTEQLIQKIEECSIVRDYKQNEHEPIEEMFDTCLDCLNCFEETAKAMTGELFSTFFSRRNFQSMAVTENLFLNLVGKSVLNEK